MQNDGPQTQLDKFKEADDDEKRWDERLRKLAKVKPEPEKSE